MRETFGKTLRLRSKLTPYFLKQEGLIYANSYTRYNKELLGKRSDFVTYRG